MSKQKLKTDIEKLNFETALSRLENIVESLGDGKVNLEKMVDLYEEAVALREHCNKRLSDAKMKVEVLLKKDQTN